QLSHTTILPPTAILAKDTCLLLVDARVFTSYLTILFLFFFFFNDPAPTEIYTLSLHDALPISHRDDRAADRRPRQRRRRHLRVRSEEHTSELQSRRDLVCRLLLEKKKKKQQHCCRQQSIGL